MPPGEPFLSSEETAGECDSSASSAKGNLEISELELDTYLHADTFIS